MRGLHRSAAAGRPCQSAAAEPPAPRKQGQGAFRAAERAECEDRAVRHVQSVEWGPLPPAPARCDLARAWKGGSDTVSTDLQPALRPLIAVLRHGHSPREGHGDRAPRRCRKRRERGREHLVRTQLFAGRRRAARFSSVTGPSPQVETQRGGPRGRGIPLPLDGNGGSSKGRVVGIQGDGACA